MNEFELSLLAAAMEDQPEPEGSEAIAPERIRQAITDGPVFSPEEKHLIWTVPSVRNTYFVVRERVALDKELELDALGLGGEIHLKAAASEEDTSAISGNGFTVLIFRDEVDGLVEWSITLQLAGNITSRLGANQSVALVDNGGQVWVEGVPVDGQLTSIWPPSDERPTDRATRYGIRLTF